MDNGSNVGNESNLLKIGVDGGTNGRAELVNDEDNEEGSCLIELLVCIGIDDVLFVVGLTAIP